MSKIDGGATSFANDVAEEVAKGKDYGVGGGCWRLER